MSYLYDVLGRRVRKQVVDHTAETDPLKTFTRNYAFDGQEMLIEYDGSNQVLARYTHSGLRTDDVLAVDVTQAGVSAKLAQGAGTYTYLKDQQGSVVDVADSSGNRLIHYIYSAFGTVLGIQDANAQELDPNSALPLKTYFSYTGREQDSESGFYYYRARYYDPAIGRFLQKDPSPGALDIPISSVNSYTYAGNNALNATDPTGMSWLDWVVDIGVAIGVGALIVFRAYPQT